MTDRTEYDEPRDRAWLESLFDAGETLATFTRIDETLPKFVEIVTEALPLATAVLLVRVGATRVFEWHADDVSDARQRAARDHADAAFSYLVRHGRRAFPDRKEGFLLLPVALPLVLHGAPTFGVFQIEPRASLGIAELVYLNAQVNQLAIALDRHFALERLRGLHAIAATLLEAPPVDAVLPSVLSLVAELLSAASVTLSMIEPDGTLRVRAHVGERAPSAGGTTLSREVVSIGRGMIRDHVLGAPLRLHGETTGVLEVVRVVPHDFTDDDMRLLELIGDRVALSVEHERLYAAAVQTARGHEALTAVVSHDLRNPLAAIRLSTDLILQSTPPSDDKVSVRRRQVELIKRSVDRLLRLVSGLLDVASIDAGMLKMDKQVVAASELARAVLDDYDPVAAQKAITFERHLADDGLLMRCDPDRIIQVLSNLVGNAIKFTERGGRIALDVERVGDAARFTISDTGRGIDASQLKHVFDRFWQASETARLGTGLGLAITKGIVEAHGGDVAVESAVGVGTTVRVTIPTGMPSIAPPDQRPSVT